nr:MAG TPA: hypothetical protein [Caudoviricetes sp.]
MEIPTEDHFVDANEKVDNNSFFARSRKSSKEK